MNVIKAMLDQEEERERTIRTASSKSNRDGRP